MNLFYLHCFKMTMTQAKSVESLPFASWFTTNHAL
uniref:Uncharacterized protein n=1 Tax=Siphoviridae sp. ctOCb13 TaxID=2825477 RepID=A0A8S5Q066_9CAUD|nr:MAG TPA: hypothetical protein [Siphoviridae sp. ctOCb13]